MAVFFNLGLYKAENNWSYKICKLREECYKFVDFSSKCRKICVMWFSLLIYLVIQIKNNLCLIKKDLLIHIRGDNLENVNFYKGMCRDIPILFSSSFISF